MLHAIRRRINDERGFTLIELLVVILIIGILAAIAIPSFLSQKDKAGDASAKSFVRNMQTAQETYFTDNNAYANSLGTLQTLEPALNDVPNRTTLPTATGDATTFTVTATSPAGVTYTIRRAADGSVARSCDRPGVGGCSSAQTW